ncbi:hypothetical protein D3C71_1390950 [compost metagenome]
MVAAHNGAFDARFLYGACQPGGHEKIVDPPAHIPLSDLRHIGPPGIHITLVRIQVAECIDETGFQQLGHFAPLLIREARIAHICLGVLQIDFTMRHIEIPAYDYGLVPVELLEIFPEPVLPLHPVSQPRKIAARVRSIHID